MRIFVGNVAFTTSEFDLEELFGRYGRVDRVQIATDRETGRSRGFAFTVFSNPLANPFFNVVHEKDVGCKKEMGVQRGGLR